MKYCSFILLSFLFCVKAFASDTTIKNLNIDYRNDTGEGSFNQFIFSDYKYPQSQSFNIQFDGSKLILELPDQDIEINDKQGFIVGVEQSNLKNFNLLSNNKMVDLRLTKLSGKDKDGATLLEGLSAKCNLTKAHDNSDVYFYIDNCLTNSVLKLGFFKAESYNNLITSLLEEALSTKATKRTTLTSTRLDINNNYFYFKTKADIGMKANLKINGQTRYLEATKEVKVTITKAKASFFNIKNKIFEELQRSESEKLRVEKPHIYIKLD